MIRKKTSALLEWNLPTVSVVLQQLKKPSLEGIKIKRFSHPSLRRNRVLRALSALAFASLALSSKPAGAARFHSFVSGSRSALSITGDLGQSDFEEFERLTRTFGPNDIVTLSSEGGSALAALKIGKIVRGRGLITFVGSKSLCTSACALIWVAGKRRMIVSGGKVGFHATYLDNNGRKTESGVGNALVGRYLTLLGLSERAVAFATLAGPNGIAWLTSSNMGKSGIDFESVRLEDLPSTRDRKSPNERQSANAWYTLSVNHACAVRTLTTNGSTFEFVLVDPLRGSGRLSIYNPNWQAIVVNNTYRIEVSLDNRQSQEEAVARRSRDGPGLIWHADRDFISKLQNSERLDLTFAGRPLASIDLQRFAPTLDSIEACTSNAK